MTPIQIMQAMLNYSEQFIAAHEAKMAAIRNTRFSTTAPKHVILPFNTKTMSHS